MLVRDKTHLDWRSIDLVSLHLSLVRDQGVQQENVLYYCIPIPTSAKDT